MGGLQQGTLAGRNSKRKIPAGDGSEQFVMGEGQPTRKQKMGVAGQAGMNGGPMHLPYVRSRASRSSLIRIRADGSCFLSFAVSDYSYFLADGLGFFFHVPVWRFQIVSIYLRLWRCRTVSVIFRSRFQTILFVCLAGFRAACTCLFRGYGLFIVDRLTVSSSCCGAPMFGGLAV